MYDYEGNDIYDGKGGQDFWTDYSTSSSDTYLVPAPPSYYEFAWSLEDFGGSYDVLDLRYEDSTRVFGWVREDRRGNDGVRESLYISMPTRSITIVDYFGSGAIEFIRFRDKILTPDQVEKLAN